MWSGQQSEREKQPCNAYNGSLIKIFARRISFIGGRARLASLGNMAFVSKALCAHRALEH